MPQLLTLEQHKTGHFGFSATKIEDLGATEYTLVSIVQDNSGSVSQFKSEMEKCIQEIIKACKHSPRHENLLIRILKFNNQSEEIHGFKLLSECDLNFYDNCLSPYGQTALYDAMIDGIEGTKNYAKHLNDNYYQTNGIIFGITDGDDNISRLSKSDVKKKLEELQKSESLESLITILIGVNLGDNNVKLILEAFNNDVGFTQFINVGNASKSSLAKLAQFVSQSISSQSKALGSGKSSQSSPIAF